MMSRFARAAVLFAALALAGCNASLEDIAPKAEKPLPAALVNKMKAKGMSRGSPIMVRIFKEEAELEVWKQKDNGRYDLVTSYDICKWSGKLGPKFAEGDRQAPEGFYTVRPAQMNPQSSYHLSFNIGYPNSYDRANGRTGSHLMVHGACSSAGCYSMTDEQVEEIYAFARDAFRGGQTAFQVQAFPFRMTPANMARYRDDPNYPFWTMLKEGYDHFEITRVPPKVDVCDRRYVFNSAPQDGYSFEPTLACPPATQPDTLLSAYQTYKSEFDAAFSTALTSAPASARSPSIAGLKEAKLVADWSRRRAAGERVSRLPPSLEPAATPATATAYAPTPAAPPADNRSEPRAQSATAATPAPVEPAAPAEAPAQAAEAPAAPADGPLGVRKRLRQIGNLFGD
ncbi:murein L,D-transpeptidase [Aquibium sp. A9E412]|uniref:L,D-transpeptidase family protein n=1 Tax=Aquibium sp. A9E412 TaxID=2976767 RepID=UPI0025AFD2D5|nr:murein L,D-transpeptidase family protein [Aquibium sp. A9E412]MDN2567644.1 murein L,D-transpeptidase [Aquibium sp. A9E412]